MYEKKSRLRTIPAIQRNFPLTGAHPRAGLLPLSGGSLRFGIVSLSCSGVKLPVGGLLESGGLCRGCSAASRWMALDSGRSRVPHSFVDYLPRVPPVMSGLHVWWSGRPLFF